MIVVDKVTGQKWQIYVKSGRLGVRDASSFIYSVGYNPVIIDSANEYLPLTTQQLFQYLMYFILQRPESTGTAVSWLLEIDNGNVGLTLGGLTPMFPWVRDEDDPTIVWEFRADNGQLYIAQLSTIGLGRIVYLLSGNVYEVYNTYCPLNFNIDLNTEIFNDITLNCLIPQEEFV